MSDFDAALPDLFDSDWRSARDSRNRPGLGTASYEAPGGDAVYFILRRVALSGGSSNDTQEYPFHGGWSTDSLNEKPHSIRVEGVVSGEDCLRRRNALVEALRVATSDDGPGHVSLSSWGRFAVVVADWDVSEEMNKQGQFPVSLTFTRAGVSEASRQAVLATSAMTLSTALENQAAIAQAAFAADLEGALSTTAMASGMTELTNALLRMVGRVQAAESRLNSISAKVQSIVSLIDQGVRAPGELAAALHGAVAGIVAGIVGTVDDLEALFSEDDEDILSTSDNALNVALSFLSAVSFDPNITVATIKDQATKNAIRNLYRAEALYGAAALLPSVSSKSYDRFRDLFGLLRALEDSIDYDNPELYTACVELRIAVSQELEGLRLYRTRTASLPVAMPALALAQQLGVGYEDFRALNPQVADEFLITGEISYA